jgi:hypothetical protein
LATLSLVDPVVEVVVVFVVVVVEVIVDLAAIAILQFYFLMCLIT